MGLGSWLYDKISTYYSSESKDISRSDLCDFDRICHEVIPGDVLLIEGTNRISNYIKSITHSPWTHAALYIGRLHSIEDPKMREIVRKYFHGSAGQQLMVETIVGKGTQLNPLTDYQHGHLRICRPTGISHSDAQKVINFVIRHLGHTYDIRHFLDLARFLLRNHWFIPRRWRSSVFKNVSTSEISKEICSTLIAEAFGSIKFPILPLVRETEDNKMEVIHRNPRLFTPSDFDYSPYFSIIKYPIFRFSSHGPYHDLPWRDDLVSQDDGIITNKAGEEITKPAKNKKS